MRFSGSVPEQGGTGCTFARCWLDAGAVCALGMGIVGIFAHVQKNVMTDPECVPEEIGRPKSKTATSMSLGVSLRKAPGCSLPSVVPAWMLFRCVRPAAVPDLRYRRGVGLPRGRLLSLWAIRYGGIGVGGHLSPVGLS